MSIPPLQASGFLGFIWFWIFGLWVFFGFLDSSRFCRIAQLDCIQDLQMTQG